MTETGLTETGMTSDTTMELRINDTGINRNRVRRYLFSGGAIAFATAAAVFYFSGGRVISTDDAYAEAARVDISTNIAGRVTRILVKENQQVHQGDPLFQLDDRDYLIAIEDAKAKLADARLQIAALKATYQERQADVRAAEATALYQTRQFERQKTLAAKGIVAQAQLDLAQHALADAQQKLIAAKQALGNVRARLNGDPAIRIDDHPAVQQARAMLERAQLSLTYTVIKAPMDGIVSKVDQLQIGNYVNAAVPVFALTSDRDVWIQANFKETELAYMHPGQQATIEIDAYPDRSFHGSVDSLSSGTGSSFSLLPPENATGNWVKVVQRLPVRIHIDDLDATHPLHAGLSAIVRVDTHHSRLKALWQ
jgi:membrane fusion protein (multidrug efflux system)